MGWEKELLRDRQKKRSDIETEKKIWERKRDIKTKK